MRIEDELPRRRRDGLAIRERREKTVLHYITSKSTKLNFCSDFKLHITVVCIDCSVNIYCYNCS